VCSFRKYHIGLWRYAKEFFEGAESIKDDLNVVKYYLYGHSIELALKSVLVFRGESEKNLKKDFGHNLLKLIDHVYKDNKREFYDKRDLIRLLNTYYEKKMFEYIFEGYKKLPEMIELRDVCLEILLDCGKIIGVPKSQLYKLNKLKVNDILRKMEQWSVLWGMSIQ